MSNILLITNNKNIIETFEKRLVLLRNSDKMSYCDYEDAPDVVFANRPDIVILHEFAEFEKTINLIKYIKTQNCSILLLIDKYNRDNVLSAYDEGIDDYFSTTSDPSEILIRTVNCIKKKDFNTKLCKYEQILKNFGILSETSGFYSRKYSAEICEEEFTLHDYSKGALTIIAPDEEGQSSYNSETMIEAIKKSVRYNDIVLNTSGTKFCIINKTSGLDGAVAIVEKIKNCLNETFSIKAGICEIKKYTFALAEKKAQCALSDAMLKHQDIAVYARENFDITEDWLDLPAKSNAQKNYKLFKQAFCKKLEKVITPVFYRLQKTYEEKINNTTIEQYTDELQSIFKLTNPKQTSMLKIVYAGMTKVIVYITHAGLDSPENREITIPVNKISTKDLTEIIETFITEFKTTVE